MTGNALAAGIAWTQKREMWVRVWDAAHNGTKPATEEVLLEEPGAKVVRISGKTIRS